MCVNAVLPCNIQKNASYTALFISVCVSVYLDALNACLDPQLLHQFPGLRYVISRRHSGPSVITPLREKPAHTPHASPFVTVTGLNNVQIFCSRMAADRSPWVTPISTSSASSLTARAAKLLTNSTGMLSPPSSIPSPPFTMLI